jgi:hypothetical protein
LGLRLPINRSTSIDIAPGHATERQRVEMRERRDMIKAGWKVFWLAAIVLAASFGAELYLVPDVVPVGYAEEAQPSWAVPTAFLLRAIELTAAWVTAIALAVTLGAWARSRLRFNSPPTQPLD